MSSDEFMNEVGDENLTYMHSVEVDVEDIDAPKKKKYRTNSQSEDYQVESDSDSDFEVIKVVKKPKVQKKPINRTYHCQYCYFTSPRKFIVDKHVRQEHVVEKPEVCTRCYKEYHLVCLTNYEYSKDDFVCKHCKDGNQISPDGADRTNQKGRKKIKGFYCNECSYIAIDLTRLRHHIRRHTGERPFKCTYCTYSTTHHQILEKHLMLHTGGEKPHKCDICNKGFIQSSNLSKHIAKEHYEKEIKEEKKEAEPLPDYYKCEICPNKCVALA